MAIQKFDVIGFDADDTLWVNEPYYREVGAEFSKLLSIYRPEEECEKILFETEVGNLDLYGYGIKSYIISALEAAQIISGGTVSNQIVRRILEMGREMLNKPVELLDGVEEVLKHLHSSGHMLLMITKGDLLDQERKLNRSNLKHYFHHVEVLSEKNDSDYAQLFDKLSIDPQKFIMVGNSMKSDILPVINLGGTGIHVPYHTTWAHEEVTLNKKIERLYSCDSISEILSKSFIQ